MKIGWFVVAFFASFNAAVNMARLLPTPPHYEAAWWKVAAGIAGFVVFVYLGIKENRHDR